MAEKLLPNSPSSSEKPRFGRLVEALWETPSATLIHTTYGRNRLGGVVWQSNVKAHASSITTQDHYCWYDGLQQVTRHDRGKSVSIRVHPWFSSRRRLFHFSLHTDDSSLLPSHSASCSSSESSSSSEPHSSSCSYHSASSSSCVPSGEVRYQYDARTRRTRKSNTAGTIDYYYDKQWRAIEERVACSVTAEYVWSPLDRWTMIRRKRGSEDLYVLKDYLDPAAIINPSGTVIERFGYDAFGPVRFMDAAFAPRTTTAAAWNFLYHAEFLDKDTGLYNYGYRYYNPQLGRWLSRDPIEEEGGLNLYGFVGNNGISQLDYLGMKPKCFIPHVPHFEDEGKSCNFSPATLDKLVLKVDILKPKTGEVMYTPVNMWVDWKISGDYKGPKWTYFSCYRDAPQVEMDYVDPSGDSPNGHIPWCDNKNCKFNACPPQNVRIDFYYLSCECDCMDNHSNCQRKWIKKHKKVGGVIEGHDKGWIGNDWHWKWVPGPMVP